MDYRIKTRQLNPTSVIYVVGVELLDGGVKLKIIGVSVFVYPPSRRSVSFHDVLEKFIRKVLITDSVLSSIGAFELMEFQNRMHQLDVPKQQ